MQFTYICTVMLDQSKSGKVTGVNTAPKKNPDEKLQVNVSVNNTNNLINSNDVAQSAVLSLPEKLKKFSEVQKLVTQRDNLTTSLQQLQTFISESNPEKGIKFSCGDVNYSHRNGDAFMTGNTNLVLMLVEFLKTKFEEQLKISDAKLLEATI